MRVALTLPRRTIGFEMDLDPNFASDVNTRAVLGQAGGCEPEVVHLMDRVLREGDTAIDAGANVGFFTLLMAKIVGPSGKILAFEPAINNSLKLSDNVALNGLKNVEIHVAPLSDKAEEVMFYMCADSGLNSMARCEDTISAATTEAVRLDDYCRQKEVRLLKMDVEGAEEKVARGGEASLFGADIPYIACELNGPALERMGSSQESLRGYMEYLGYHTFLLSNIGVIPTLIPPKTKITTAQRNLNVLFSTIDRVSEAWREVNLDR